MMIINHENIEKDIKFNEWYIQELKSAISEANNGEFATKEQISALFKKWKVYE